MWTTCYLLRGITLACAQMSYRSKGYANREAFVSTCDSNRAATATKSHSTRASLGAKSHSTRASLGAKSNPSSPTRKQICASI